eukprot:m.28481 g.28481  ORF g.28481 m.28481 type:complete len:563 (-) comp6555_c0_seq2:2390-4078(-)
MRSVVKLGASLLDVATLRQCSLGTTQIKVAKSAMDRVRVGRAVVDNIVDKGDVAYGINTGFGLFANVVVSPSQLAELQTNLIRSHAAGIGQPLSIEQTRMLLVLRINTLAKGHSGVRPETLSKMVDAFNADAISVVPSQGTVGASGDLAPLSHLALGLMGEGEMWDTQTNEIRPASAVLHERGLEPITLHAKEGLALINGTQMITALGAEAVHQARNAALCADIACALTVEVLKGTPRAFHPSIHSVRPHKGQQQVATRLRTLLSPTSDLFRSHEHKGRVQDAYSLRCAPQVHGVVHDTIDFVESVITTEMNSATDNPMVFTGSDEDLSGWGLDDEDDEAAPPPTDTLHDLDTYKMIKDTFYRGGGGFIISGGNFHGEYPAKVLDYLAIGISEIASISERRLERLVNPSLSELPAFLVKDGGLHSGFMIAHCTAAALTSENKVLCHPSSVDSISTSGSKEDHVSMGGFSARKAVQVVRNVEMVVAIELLAACQALDLSRPLKTTPRLEAVYDLVRSHVNPWDGDRYMAPDLDAAVNLIRTGQVMQAASPTGDLKWGDEGPHY